jgi:hypothetical protein
MNFFKKDLVSIGIIIGLLLPVIFCGAFIAYSSSRFGSFMACYKHFQLIGLLYKIVSLSLMPGVGLFFLWTKYNMLNNARGMLLITMFYGIVVLLLYMN